MLTVFVVGAGIAGLSTSVALRRAGHHVHVYERSALNNEVGAAINVPPNATRFLLPWGLDPTRWRFVKSRRITHTDPFTMETLAVVSEETSPRSIAGSDLYYAHRLDLHNALMWMATREDGPGMPVKIHLNSCVIGYDTQKPSIRLKGDVEIGCDLVIGADGVHSLASQAILGYENPVVRPEFFNCCYRFLIPAAALQEDPEKQFWLEDVDGWTRVFPHLQSRRRIIAYPCRDNTMHNFVCIFYDGNAEMERENWHTSVSIAEALERFSDFSPKLIKVMSWHKDCLTLVGDSAHPMLPHQAQGGAQGLEDGLALGIALCGASSRKDIMERLEIYEVRYSRASVIQILSHVGQDQTQLIRHELSHYLAEDDIPSTVKEVIKFNLAYDVVDAMLRAMRAYKADFKLPVDFFEAEVSGVPTAA